MRLTVYNTTAEYMSVNQPISQFNTSVVNSDCVWRNADQFSTNHNSNKSYVVLTITQLSDVPQ